MNQLALSFTSDRRSIDARFAEFHEANPEVLAEIIATALQLKAAGASRGAVRDIFGRMRIDRQLRVNRDASGFYLNDQYTAHFARLAMEVEPRLAGFFECRSLRSVA